MAQIRNSSLRPVLTGKHCDAVPSGRRR